jgi:hypothetical protein
VFNPTWLATGAVYAGAVWLARRGGIDLPRRVAVFFYLLVFVFFYPILTQDAVHTPAGVLNVAHQVRESWRSPLLANPQSATFSPLRILGLPLSLAHALSFEAAMKVLIALTFTFLWCRRRGSSELASATGAVVFGFWPFFIARQHDPLFAAACLVPAVFYVFDNLVERVTYARFVALSLAGAAMLLCGHPRTALLTAAFAMLYSSKRLLPLIGASVVAAFLAAPFLAPFADAVRHASPQSDWGIRVFLVFLLAALTAYAIDRFLRDRIVPQMLLLVAVIAALWIPAPSARIERKTPMLHALDELTKKEKAPFRIAGNAETYAYEDVRVDGSMATTRYIGLLSHFARWPDFEHPLLDYLNVRYVITPANGTLPPRFHPRYDGPDGRICENTEVLPRFFAVRNIMIDFRDASFANRLKEHRDWGQTALLETLDVESPQQRDDFFKPRAADAPIAVAEIRDAKLADYRIHVRAPRWSLVVSSIPWWPGWKVERNGTRIEPMRVNGAFLGFAVPPGELDVRVWYDPWTLRLGAILSAATLAALVAYGVRHKS